MPLMSAVSSAEYHRERECQLTSRISSKDMAPDKSCLFANTSKVAPASLYWDQLLPPHTEAGTERHSWNLLTSSPRRPLNSDPQSLIRNLSPESTTQTTASVDSK